MDNERLIKKILKWEHGCPNFRDDSWKKFWARTNSSAVFDALEPDLTAVTNCGVNEHWFAHQRQVVLTSEDFAVYTAKDYPRYKLVQRLPLTENRDELIAAVRMMMALEVGHE